MMLMRIEIKKGMPSLKASKAGRDFHRRQQPAHDQARSSNQKDSNLESLSLKALIKVLVK